MQKTIKVLKVSASDNFHYKGNHVGDQEVAIKLSLLVKSLLTLKVEESTSVLLQLEYSRRLDKVDLDLPA